MKGGLKGIPKGQTPKPEQPLPPHDEIMRRLACFYEKYEPKSESESESEFNEPVIQQRYLPTLTVALAKANAYIARREQQEQQKENATS